MFQYMRVYMYLVLGLFYTTESVFSLQAIHIYVLDIIFLSFPVVVAKYETCSVGNGFRV